MIPSSNFLQLLLPPSLSVSESLSLSLTHLLLLASNLTHFYNHTQRWSFSSQIIISFHQYHCVTCSPNRQQHCCLQWVTFSKPSDDSISLLPLQLQKAKGKGFNDAEAPCSQLQKASKGQRWRELYARQLQHQCGHLPEKLPTPIIFTLDYHATRATIAAPLLSSASSSSKSSTSRFFFFNSHQSIPLPLSTSKATANPP